MARPSKKSHSIRQATVSAGKLRHWQVIKALRDSDASIQRLADKVPAAIFIFQGSKNRLVNPAAEALTGYTRKELLRMEFWQILHPDFKELVKERGLRRQKSTGVPPRYEVKIIRKDGEERWLDYSGGMIKFHGEMAVIGTAIDITERKRAEEQVHRNLRRTRALHEANLAATSTLDLKCVLDVLLESIDRFFSCPIISAVRIMNARTGFPETKTVRNMAEEEWAKVIPWGGHGLSKAVLENKQAVMVVDALADPRTRYPEFFREYGLVSFLGVPLIANGIVLGDISLFTKEKHLFNDEEIDFICTLGAQAAVAIQNSKLYEEMKWKTREISALNALTAATTQSLDPDSVVQEAVRAIADLLHFDGVRIYLFDKTSHALHLKASEIETDLCPRVSVAQTGKGLIGRVAQSGEIVILEDIQTDPRYEEFSQTRSAKKSGVKFFTVFPIQSKFKSWGALSCIGRESRRLRVDEIDLLITLCNQVATAIENATLFQQTAEKAKELSALYSVVATSSEVLDVNTLLYRGMRKVLDIFEFTAGRIYIVDNDKKEIRLAAQEGFPADITPVKSYRLGEGLIGKVLETGLPLTFEDMQSDADYHQQARAKVILKAGFRASVFIPLRVRGETLGVMNLVSKEPHTFSPSDIQLINSIAYHLGVAVGNANSFSRLTQKTLDLEKANKAKDEFLSVMSHELRTPLNVIMGYTEIMQDGMFGDLRPDLQIAVTKVEKQTMSLLAMIEEILVATRIEAGVIKLESKDINVANFVAELKSSYDLPLRPDFRLIWNIALGLPTVKTDDGKLKHILLNLINNALKFTEKGQVTVSACYTPGTNKVEFSVADTGIGIKRDKISAIFDMFHQVDSSETRVYEGVGLGLYIVKKFTELLCGTIKVESEFGKGSTFTVAIPLGV
jgi:PAS domain S-box-containing protein